MNVFITGATGLLGSNVVPALRAKGYRVTALARDPEKARRILGPEVELVQGDMAEIGRFSKRLEGMNTLVHAAASYGEYYRTGDENNLKNINVKGTTELLEAADRNGIKNIVYVSSAAVLHTEEGREAEESCPYADGGEPYFQSKIDAEKSVFRFLKDHPWMRIVLVLPTVMLGPGDRGPTPNGNFVLEYMHGKFKRIIHGYNRIVDVRDAAEAVTAAIENGRSGERYIVGGRKYDYAEIFAVLADVTGNPPLTKLMPSWVLMLVARLVTMISTMKGKPSPLKPAIVKRLRKNFWYDSGKAERELRINFRPLRDTLHDTVVWFKENGYA